MNKRKFSTGTKGRIKQHASECKTAVLQRCGNEALAAEFIAEIDPDRNDSAWEVFSSQQECIARLEVWLDGVGGKPEPPRTSNEAIIMSALTAKLAERKEASSNKKSKVQLAIAEVRNWSESAEGVQELSRLSPKGIVRYILGRLEIILSNSEFE
jgi:hypothetical protein